MARLWVDIFLDAHREAPAEISRDLDATDATLHGHQEARFFHGYYDSYCYLPLYIFCGEHLLLAKLRPANIDGAAGAREEVEQIVSQLRERWPRTQIITARRLGLLSRRADALVRGKRRGLRVWVGTQCTLGARDWGRAASGSVRVCADPAPGPALP